jgi:hypothetical protein
VIVAADDNGGRKVKALASVRALVKECMKAPLRCMGVASLRRKPIPPVRWCQSEVKNSARGDIFAGTHGVF